MKDSKMVVRNSKGEYHYEYTQLGKKKVYYRTKIYPVNGLKERKRRIKQMMKVKV